MCVWGGGGGGEGEGVQGSKNLNSRFMVAKTRNCSRVICVRDISSILRYYLQQIGCYGNGRPIGYFEKRLKIKKNTVDFFSIKDTFLSSLKQYF